MSPKLPRGRPANGGAEALTCILDQFPTAPPSDCLDRLDPARATEHVDGQDRPSPARGGRLQEVRIDPEAVLLDVDEPGYGALVQQAVGRGDKAERSRNDLVPIADLQGAYAKMEPRRAARACDGLASVGASGKVSFETLSEWAHGERVARENLGHQLKFPRTNVRLRQRDRSFDGRPGFAHLTLLGDGGSDRWAPGDCAAGASRKHGGCRHHITVPRSQTRVMGDAATTADRQTVRPIDAPKEPGGGRLPCGRRRTPRPAGDLQLDVRAFVRVSTGRPMNRRRGESALVCQGRPVPHHE